MFECIKKRLSPKPPAHTPVAENGEDGYFAPIWGFVCPHNKKQPGAVSFDRKYSEFIYGQIMIPEIGAPWNTRPYGPGVMNQLQDAVNPLVKHHKVNAIILPHGNAFNKKANGFEVYYLEGDMLSKKYADEIIAAFKEKYPDRKCRGAKVSRYKSRGYWNMVGAKRAGAKIVILSELFFIDNLKDWLSPEEQAAFWRETLDINHID